MRREQCSGPTGIAEPPALEARLPIVWAAPAFAAVELVAAWMRQRMGVAPSGPLASPAVALLAATVWTYLAHTRLAFRGFPNAGLATLAPYVALSAALAITQSPAMRNGVRGLDAIAPFAIAAGLKFIVLRTMVWPVQRAATALT